MKSCIKLRHKVFFKKVNDIKYKENEYEKDGDGFNLGTTSILCGIY
jgi:hypothetical protein